MEKNSFYSEVYENLDRSSKEISRKEFEKCTFRNCNFSDGKLLYTRFTDCIFISCNFSMAKLNGSTLVDARFEDCKIMGVVFSDCTDAFFSVGFKNCIMDYASFANKKMPRTVFDKCSLKSADFAKTNLTGSSFDYCNLADAVFAETILIDADFINAENYVINPQSNKIKNAAFSLHGLPGLLHEFRIRVK